MFEKSTKLNGKNTVSDLMIRKCYNGDFVKVDWLTYFYIWESTTRLRYTYEKMQLNAFYCMDNIIHSSALHYWKDTKDSDCFYLQTVNYTLNSSVAEIHLYHINNLIAQNNPICYCRVKYWKEEKGFLISDHSFITKIY
jgi:hypothetical protein